MPAGAYNFTCEQGAHFERTVTVTLPDGTAMNLSGYTARMHVRKDVNAATTLVELTTENGRIAITPATGLLTLTLTSSVTAGIAKSGVYDLEIVETATERVTRVIEGQFILKQNVTR
jgi:hypothetical protein